MYSSFKTIFYLEKNGDSNEIYVGNSIFHSKFVRNADETFKNFIKEN